MKFTHLKSYDEKAEVGGKTFVATSVVETMTENAGDFLDPKIGEVNMTGLAEWAFGYLTGPAFPVTEIPEMFFDCAYEAAYRYCSDEYGPDMDEPEYFDYSGCPRNS